MSDTTRPVETMEIERIEPGPGGATVGTVWNAPGDTYDDAAVMRSTVYHYRARACNSAGCSPWSGLLTVSLVSAVCSVTITEPADNATLTGIHLAQMHVTDTGAGATLQRFEADAAPLAPVIRLAGDTAQDGRYRIVWDTREWLQGTVKLRAWALGSDGLWAFDEITLLLANTLASNVQYVDVGPCQVTRADKLLRKVHIGIETPALSTKPRYQWWAIPGLRAWMLGQSDPAATVPTTPEEAVLQFKAHQRVSFGTGKKVTAQGRRPERRAYYEVPKLTTAAPTGAQVVMLRLQLFEREFMSAYKLAPSTLLIKARESQTAGEVVLFGTGTASVWTFKDGTPTLKKDLSTVALATATDAAVIGDKVYAVKGGALWVVDTDEGTAPYRISLYAADGTPDTRPVKFVERIGTALAVLCVDAAQTPATVAYRVSGDEVKPLWNMTKAVTRTDAANGSALALASGLGGSELWRSANLAAPALVKTFAGAITALDALRVGLDNGDVMWFNGVAWVREIGLTVDGDAAPVAAVSALTGLSDTLRGIAAPSGSVQLYEQGTDGLWGTGRIVENPTESPDGVSEVLAMRRLVTIEDIPADELTGGPGEATTREVEKLLLLTGDDGLLVTVELARIDESAGAVALTELSTVNIVPGGAYEPLPAEA